MDPRETPDLVLRRAALAEGWSDEELGRRIRRGELTRLRPGAYAAPEVARDPVRRHRRMVTATLAALRRPAVVSHQSAAVLHGLPLWGVPLGRVHVTRTPPATAEVGRALHCHVARLREDDVVVVDGLAVTGVVRTALDLALDLARTLPFEGGGRDARRGAAPPPARPGAARGRPGRLGRVPGVRSATRAVRFADGRSESVGESRSRVLLHRLGLMPSTLQLEVADAAGGSLGRAVFAWEEERVVGEFDGRVKSPAGGSPTLRDRSRRRSAEPARRVAPWGGR